MIMYKTSIFQKNIARHSTESEKAIGFDNCNVDISTKHLRITNGGTELLNSDLKFLEEDFSTISYLGKYKNRIEFRVIRPTDLSLANLKNRFDCEAAFSIASVDPSSYAVHFILSNSNQSPNIGNVVDKGKKEQVQRLIDGSIRALQVNLQSNFIDFSKRILSLISDTRELMEYNNADQIVEVMKANRHIFSETENKQIK
ncbi:hypothetical protein W5A_13086 [Imtechella halotolerans K1]|uniref:Uncharacterized protein n=2 Tax=Imtechella TaxID=1165076 RepID=I0W7S7_9FLAO|nr:hypothetical protein W5A_13086 [Imtechella halotolerans K1]